MTAKTLFSNKNILALGNETVSLEHNNFLSEIYFAGSGKNALSNWNCVPATKIFLTILKFDNVLLFYVS